MTEIATETDRTIYREVLDEITLDSLLEESEVGVEVDKGVVTLTGDVDSHAKRIAAEEAAQHVVGVFDVANEIKVHLPGRALGRPDRQVAHAVRRALDAAVFVAGKPIESTVSQGWVTLRGEVDYWLQSEDAERAVLQVPGVLGVVNTLSVRAQGWPRKVSGR